MTLTADPLSFDMAPQPRQRWGSVASALLHGGFLLLLLLGAGAGQLEPAAVRSVAVELVSAAQFAALLATNAPLPSIPGPEVTPVPDVTPVPKVEPATPVPEPTAPAANAPITATEFFAGGLLAEPESAGLRRALAQTESNERLVQLCDIEAMAQIRQARPEYDPDMVVAYAMAETVRRDGALVADGAAFRSQREWYELRFTCAAKADFSGVTAFEFTVGEFIPHEQWDAHYLTAEEIGD